MATFSEWLVFEEIREDVYEKSLRRLHLRETLRRTFEFYNNAVTGRWDLILENALDDDDDGPAPEYDPFADGDEDARPTWEDPEYDSSAADQPPPPTEKRPSKPKIDTLLSARSIQRYAQIVRWSAMLERRDYVEKVRRIYEDEVVPLLSRNEWLHREADNDVDDDFDDSDEAWGISKRFNSAPAPAPAPAPKMAPSTGLNKMSVVSKLKPLLEELGYSNEGDLDYGTEDERFEKAAKASAFASEERGNDPPESHPDVQILIKNPDSRKQYAQLMMSELEDILRKKARSIYLQIRKPQGSEGGERKYGAEMDEDEILNYAIGINMRKLQRRLVKKDGTATKWDDKLEVLNIGVDDEESASKLIGLIKSPISNPARALRDKRRAAAKASGESPGEKGVFTCSDCGHTRAVSSRHVGTKMKCPKCRGEGTVKQRAASVSHDSGATAEDGTVTSMDVVDTKTRQAPDAASAAETSRDMILAFQDAMKELSESDPSKATLVCLWLGLHGGDPKSCKEPAWSPSTDAIFKLFSSARVNSSDRSLPSEIFEKMGINNLFPGAKHGQTTEARWNLIKLIKQQNIIGGVFGGMPTGELPRDWTPNYSKRIENTPEQHSWYKYMNAIIDTLSKKCLPFLARRMQEILAGRQSEIKPQGLESPCIWSLRKFLNLNFAQSIRAGTTSVSGENPMNLTIYGKSKKKTILRNYSIDIDPQRITIEFLGDEKKVRTYAHPQPNQPCPKCNGAGGNCAECEGCGKIIDRMDAFKTERDINIFLLTQVGTRQARQQRV